jgi:hypothetical protein
MGGHFVSPLPPLSWNGLEFRPSMGTLRFPIPLSRGDASVPTPLSHGTDLNFTPLSWNGLEFHPSLMKMVSIHLRWFRLERLLRLLRFPPVVRQARFMDPAA